MQNAQKHDNFTSHISAFGIGEDLVKGFEAELGAVLDRYKRESFSTHTTYRLDDILDQPVLLKLQEFHRQEKDMEYIHLIVDGGKYYLFEQREQGNHDPYFQVSIRNFNQDH